MFFPSIMILADGYKLDHRRQYVDGIQYICSNGTFRATRIAGDKEVVFFGLQGFLQHYLTDYANFTFFDQPKQKMVDEYQRTIDNYMGPNDISTNHIAALHDYGKIPLEFCAVPEGTRIPLRIPPFTIENTHPDFFWVTNYFETLISSCVWPACTSATTAYKYRKLGNSYAELTGTDPLFVAFQGHDFSFRGMMGPEAAMFSGAGHMLSFNGTDSIPVIPYLQEYYDMGDVGPHGVPATEHSVMCAGGQESEIDTFRRLMKLYPTGILSVVSDTWDFWNVITNILPQLKDEIMARDGKLVIRPDSGDPVKIICGDPEAPKDSPAYRGAVQCLWKIFGGAGTARGYKLLDSHIGLIYGDSITLERADTICNRLARKLFASGNVVFGIGSYTYQYVTRDTYGFAIKATWAQDSSGKEHFLFKTPKTDDGTKNSARGRIVVVKDEFGGFHMWDSFTKAEQANLNARAGLSSLLKPVWREGQFLRKQTFADIRQRLFA